mmetsp:Transcript_973/g.1770  ORF Transcript_973/g.1770 Transcript_973/m.1770 type:complete len:318 (-) Transcript_973:1282-2235(-)|eukprot:CAMPEP_0116547568 /NCGR_PEP_ID=MMETSP0397-20121206/3850_1 /TAXON_ID=216820 /ORGANISM="Cyclophora tenuis, Strain ECT3854" /LENGTH=317 /DNA_ID=CAMNT_0004072115 /DNA_START=1121 /DNA_END=2074 /DNA_ORIENTATION=-
MSTSSVLSSRKALGHCRRVCTQLQQCVLRGLSTRPSSNDEKGEIVSVLRLNTLMDNPGAAKKGRRIGRGIGSSKGKTSGRGHKGQKSRSGGNIHPMFEGGQTKFYKRIPKRGFKNAHAQPMVPLNVGTLQDYIDMGRLSIDGSNDKEDATTLTIADLVKAGMMKKNSIKHGVKLLAKGKERLRTPVNLQISRASREAIDAIERVGGTVTTVHYNALALRVLLSPDKFPLPLPKQARPPPRLMPYYTNWKNRGYLSPQAQMEQLLRERPDLQDKLNHLHNDDSDNIRTDESDQDAADEQPRPEAVDKSSAEEEDKPKE